MNDLDVYLETGNGTVLDSSISSATNVEHIFFNLTGAGDYKIVVTYNNGGLGDFPIQKYGLAWWWGNGTPPLSGDFNTDGKVDSADYVVWRKDPASFGGAGGYDTWRANFGAGAGSGASLASVPEPSVLLLFSIAVIFGAAKRRREWSSHALLA